MSDFFRMIDEALNDFAPYMTQQFRDYLKTNATQSQKAVAKTNIEIFIKALVLRQDGLQELDGIDSDSVRLQDYKKRVAKALSDLRSALNLC